MSDKKDNVIMFPTKAKVPDTLTISFGDSKPVTYTLSSDNIDLTALDTVTVDIGEYPLECMYTGDNINITVTDPVEMLEAEMIRQMNLDFDDDTE